MDQVERIKLIGVKVEILRLKADSYEWQCTVPKDVKEQLEKTLQEIDTMLGVGATAQQTSVSEEKK